MDKIPATLQFSNIKGIKTYSLAWVKLTGTLANSQVFLIDKKHRKIWMYEMKSAAKDMTAKLKGVHERNKNKSWENRNVYGNLYKIMIDECDTLHWVDVFAHSNSAKEIEAMVYEIRAMQAELWLNICRNHSNWKDEEQTALHFCNL